MCNSPKCSFFSEKSLNTAFFFESFCISDLSIKIQSPMSFSHLFLSCVLLKITLSLFSFYPDPFVIQGIAGCELHTGKAIGSFLKGAFRGLDFMSIKNDSCAPAPEGGSKAQRFCALIIQYQAICDTIAKLRLETCPRYLLSVLDAGKAELQRQG